MTGASIRVAATGTRMTRMMTLIGWVCLLCLCCCSSSLVTAQAQTEHSHYVFVFRHCLRPTKSSINLFDAETLEGSSYSQDLKDYINVSLPEWDGEEASEDDCTQYGAQQLKLIGEHLMKLYFEDVDKISFEIISDTPNRNVLSSSMLVEGLDDGKSARTELVGNSIAYDEALFHPTRMVEIPGSTQRLCEEPSAEDLNEDIQKRLEAVSIPSLSLADALATVTSYSDGPGLVGPLELLPQNLELNRELHRIKGAVNLVAAVAETAFYARASKMTDFWKDAPFEDIMSLMAWHYWLRNVVDVQTIYSAMAGSVLVLRLLQQLQVTPENGEDVIKVTIFVGHDTTLDDFATALGMTWTLPGPYPSSPRATPPASALLFRRSKPQDDLAEYIDIAVLSPNLIHEQTGDSNEEMVYLSGDFTSNPVELIGMETYSSQWEQFTRIQGSEEFPNPLLLLRNHMTSIIGNEYAQSATDCYIAAQLHYHDGQTEITTTTPSASPVVASEPGDNSDTTTTPPSASPVTTAEPGMPESEPTMAPTPWNGDEAPLLPTSEFQPQDETTPPIPTPAPFEDLRPTSMVVPTTEYYEPNPVAAPTWPPHQQYGNTSSNASTSESSFSPILVGFVVTIVLVGMLVFLRKPISRALGLESRGRGRQSYSGMSGNDLDFNIEMI